MKLAIAAALFAAAFNLGSIPAAHAIDMVDYRANPDRSCRVVEIQTINRWGTEVTIRRLVCD